MKKQIQSILLAAAFAGLILGTTSCAGPQQQKVSSGEMQADKSCCSGDTANEASGQSCCSSKE